MVTLPDIHVKKLKIFKGIQKNDQGNIQFFFFSIRSIPKSMSNLRQKC